MEWRQLANYPTHYVSSNGDVKREDGKGQKLTHTTDGIDDYVRGTLEAKVILQSHPSATWPE